MRSRRNVSARRISPAPGRNASTEPCSARSARAAASATCRSIGAAAIAAEIARLDRKGAAFALDRPGASPSSRATRAPSMVADITRIFRSSRRPRCTSRASAKPEIGVERALVEFVEEERRDAVERGIVEHHAREHAFGDELDAGLARHFRGEAHAVADGFADRLAKRCRHTRGRGAGGEPARLEHDDLLARAHGSRASASGTRVVLPAPGGATSTAALAARSAAVSAGNTSSMGSGVVISVNSVLIAPLALILNR